MKRSVIIWLEAGCSTLVEWSQHIDPTSSIIAGPSLCFCFDQPKECKMVSTWLVPHGFVEWNGRCLNMSQTCVPRCLNRMFKLLQHFHPRKVDDGGSRCSDNLRSEQLKSYCVMSAVKAEINVQNHITKNFVGLHDHSPLVTTIGLLEFFFLLDSIKVPYY